MLHSLLLSSTLWIGQSGSPPIETLPVELRPSHRTQTTVPDETPAATAPLPPAPARLPDIVPEQPAPAAAKPRQAPQWWWGYLQSPPQDMQPAPLTMAPDQPPPLKAPEKPPAPVEFSVPALPPPLAVPAAAPAAPGAASPPSRWMLMRCLQGTWWGACMDTERFSIYGWDQMSFTGSTVDDLNLPMSWNYRANQFLLQQNWVRFDRSVITTGTTEPTFGGRVDMIYGTDYRFTLPQRGLLQDQLTDGPGGTPQEYGFDPVQMYGEAYFPTIFRGLDLKVGRFYCLYGVESIEAVSTPLISHSYTFSNGSPFTHTGLMATAVVTPIWTVQVMAVVGSDLFISEADRPTFSGSIQWTQPGGRNLVKASTILGPGKFEQDLNVNNINVFDVVYTHLFSSRPNSYSTLHPEWTMPIPSPGMSYQAEALFGYQRDAPLPNGSVGTALWYSFVQYLNYQFTPRLCGVARLEFFEDMQGQRTGFKGLYTAPALCGIYKLKPGVVICSELRYDYNEENRAFDNNKNLFTAAADLILRW
jgi:hypothetical protein